MFGQTGAVADRSTFGRSHDAPYDHVVSYLKQTLGFIGLFHITVVRPERQNLGLSRLDSN